MTKNELVIALNDFNDDDIVVIICGEGWSNIEDVNKNGCAIEITIEEYPVFSDGWLTYNDKAKQPPLFGGLIWAPY